MLDNQLTAKCLYTMLAVRCLFPDCLLLSSLHNIWQFVALVFPPSCQGVIWSASIPSILKCSLQTTQIPFCLSYASRFWFVLNVYVWALELWIYAVIVVFHYEEPCELRGSRTVLWEVWGWDFPLPTRFSFSVVCFVVISCLFGCVGLCYF